MAGLSDTEERFAAEFAKDLNATEAYLRVFPNVKRASAATLGGRMLRKVETLARVKAIIRTALDEAGKTAADVIRELERLAFSDITECLETGPDNIPQIADLKELPEATRRALKSVKVKYYDPITNRDGETVREGYHTIEFAMHDKRGALDTLAKYHGLLGDKDLGTDTQPLVVRFVGGPGMSRGA